MKFFSISNLSPIALLLAMACSNAAQAVEIKVLSGNGAKSAVTELGAQFERLSGHKVTIHFEVNPGVKKRIDDGEAFDVAVLNPPFLDEQIKNGKIIANTRTVLGRAGIGAAIRAGAPKPDISTVEGFKNALLASKSVAYPGEGSSGRYFVTVIERMGLTQAMASKMRPMPAEYNVEVVASGEVDMVVVVASRINGVPGVQSLGTIPQSLQTWIGFTAGLARHAKEQEAASELLRFFKSPAAEKILRDKGVEPFVE